MPELEDLCVCRHEYGDHSAKVGHRCLGCRCTGFRPKATRVEAPSGPSVVFVDGENGEAQPVTPKNVLAAPLGEVVRSRKAAGRA